MNNFNLNELAQRFKRQKYTVDDYVNGILNGNRSILSQAITLIESKLEKHQILAQQIISCCLPHAGRSFRVGITGSPGVGKSTFIENFGLEIIQQNQKVAVLAIDPSSQLSGGSILGDKTRMQLLAVENQVFIRPSPAGQTLGGVAQKTRETIILCEAAGFELILVETVGVGQSETLVQSMVDFFMLLLLPNAGDDLQGIKRGVMEMSDLVVINKADGDAVLLAQLAQRQAMNGLHLFPAKSSGWTAQAVLASALEKKGIAEIWQIAQHFLQISTTNGFFAQQRAEQSRYWLHQSIQEKLETAFYQHAEISKHLILLEQKVKNGEISPFYAAELLLNQFLHL
jgi:LAO/AO transport system kinase